jgi:cytochrome c biogenesis protein CcmG/thiol:disulfide interchange protein DsbE
MNNAQPTRTGGRWTAIIPIVVVALLVGAFAKRLIDVESGQDPALVQSVLEPGLKTPDLKKEVSLVNVWGSWCIACLSEHPLLMDLAEQKQVPIHGIAWRDDPSASVRWLARNGDPYDLIGQDPVSEAAIAFGVTGAPETFVIDGDGIIRYKHIGPITPDVWANTIAPMVEQLRQ